MCELASSVSLSLSRIVAPITSLSASLGLDDASTATLLETVASVVGKECTRIGTLHGSNVVIGPGQVLQATQDPATSALLVGWVCPALNDGVSYGCAITDGVKRIHLISSGLSLASLYGLVVATTFSLVSHDGALVVEAQAPSCILSFADICKLIMRAASSPVHFPSMPPRFHVCGTVGSVGAPFHVQRGGGIAMLIVLLVNPTCTICGKACTGAATRTTAASTLTSISVTLLVKGSDLVPQWRDLAAPGQVLSLVGLEKQRLYTAEGPDAAHVTVLRVRQHPPSVTQWLALSNAKSEAKSSVSLLGTIALSSPSDIEGAPSNSGWTGLCVGEATLVAGSSLGMTGLRERGSCVTYSGIVTRITKAAVVLDRDPRTTLWWLPQRGRASRPSLPVALRVGCRATFHNVHALIVGRRLVGLGWCTATNITVSDLSSGWLGLGAFHQHTPTLIGAEDWRPDLNPDCFASAPEQVWMQSCLQRLVLAGLAIPFIKSRLPLCYVDGKAISACDFDAWRKLHDIVESALGGAPCSATFEPQPSVSSHMPSLTSVQAAGPVRFELLARLCERSALWDGDKCVASQRADASDVIPVPLCLRFQAFPARHAILTFTPRQVFALGSDIAMVLSSALRRSSIFAAYKDGHAVRAHQGSTTSELLRAVRSSDIVSSCLHDFGSDDGAVTFAFSPSNDWISARVRITRLDRCPLPALISRATSTTFCAGAVGYRQVLLQDSHVSLMTLVNAEPQQSSDSCAGSSGIDQSLPQIALCEDFSLFVDVLRFPTLSAPNVVQPQLGSGTEHESPYPGFLQDGIDFLDTRPLAPPALSAVPSPHEWRHIQAPLFSRKRRRRSSIGKTTTSIEPFVPKFAIRMYLRVGAGSCRFDETHPTCALTASGTKAGLPLLCSVRATLTGLGDALAALMKKAHVRPVLVGAVENVSLLPPPASSSRGGAVTSGAALVTSAVLKLRLRHMPLVLRDVRPYGNVPVCSFGPETVDVYLPCTFSFESNDFSVNLPLGLSPGSIVAIEHVRPVVAAKSRNLYWMGQDGSEFKPTIHVVTMAGCEVPTSTEELLRCLTATLMGQHLQHAGAATALEKGNRVLVLDNLLWPNGGEPSATLGTLFPSLRTCRSLANDFVFNRTQVYLRGKPRQIMWACAQWEDGVTGCPLVPRMTGSVGFFDAASRRRALLSGGCFDGSCIFGVPMHRRVGTGVEQPASALCSVNPLFKLEAKVAIDDGTGEAVVQLHDAYTLTELEMFAADLEGLATIRDDGRRDRMWSSPFRLGVASTVLQVSAFWLAHWAAAAAFFGPLHVLPRLAAATAAAVAAASAVPSSDVPPLSSHAASVASHGPPDAVARFSPLLAVKSFVPEGWFGHLNINAASASAACSSGESLDYGCGHAGKVKRRDRRRSSFTSAASAVPSAVARFTARLPYASVEVATAVLYQHLARSVTVPILAVDYVEGVPLSSPSASAKYRKPVAAFDFICVRVFSAPVGGVDYSMDGDPPSVDPQDIKGRAVARHLAEIPLRRLLGLSIPAAACNGTFPASRKNNVCLPTSPKKVVLRCLDVHPVFVRVELDELVKTCNAQLGRAASTTSADVFALSA